MTNGRGGSSAGQTARSQATPTPSKSRQARARLSPEEIRGRQFQVGLRGFDTHEVRSFLEEVATALEAALVATDEPLDTDDLFTLLGEEVASVLRSARATAASLAASAEVKAAEDLDEANQLLEEAKAESARLRREAAEILERARRERDELLADTRARHQAVVSAQAQLQQAAALAREYIVKAERAFADVRIQAGASGGEAGAARSAGSAGVGPAAGEDQPDGQAAASAPPL